MCSPLDKPLNVCHKWNLVLSGHDRFLLFILWSIYCIQSIFYYIHTCIYCMHMCFEQLMHVRLEIHHYIMSNWQYCFHEVWVQGFHLLWTIHTTKGIGLQFEILATSFPWPHGWFYYCSRLHTFHCIIYVYFPTTHVIDEGHPSIWSNI